jgi:prophage regulatory protein
MSQSTLPEVGYLRLPQIIGNRARGIPALIPVCASSWWVGVREGRYPAGVRIGKRAVAWRVEDIRKLIAEGLQS